MIGEFPAQMVSNADDLIYSLDDIISYGYGKQNNTDNMCCHNEIHGITFSIIVQKKCM